MLTRRSSAGVFDALQRNADGPIPQDPSKRKLIFCNADGITYLGNNERIPMGNQAGEPVCKCNEIGYYICLEKSFFYLIGKCRKTISNFQKYHKGSRLTLCLSQSRRA